MAETSGAGAATAAPARKGEFRFKQDYRGGFTVLGADGKPVSEQLSANKGQIVKLTAAQVAHFVSKGRAAILEAVDDAAKDMLKVR